jgi:hypothetical protein
VEVANPRCSATSYARVRSDHRQRSFMPDAKTSRRTTAAAALSILLLACIGLAACGGSSSTTSSGANAASTGTASTGSSTSGTSSTGASSTGANAPTPGSGRGAARFAAIRECMRRNGITLPQRTPGSGRPGGGFPGGGAGAGGAQLPKGVTRAQYEAALKKCGGGGFGRGNRFAQNPVFKTAIVKYSECLRQNGVNISAPNTSGNGPVFDTKGINTTSPQFKAATTKCRATLLDAFRSLRGSHGPSSGASGASAGGSGTG